MCLVIMKFKSFSSMELASQRRELQQLPSKLFGNMLTLSVLMYGFQVIQKKATEAIRRQCLAFCFRFIKAMASLDTDVMMVPADEGPSDTPPSFSASSASLSSKKAKRFEIKKWNTVTL